jgi:hypothetical protein
VVAVSIPIGETPGRPRTALDTWPPQELLSPAGVSQAKAQPPAPWSLTCHGGLKKALRPQPAEEKSTGGKCHRGGQRSTEAGQAAIPRASPHCVQGQHSRPGAGTPLTFYLFIYLAVLGLELRVYTLSHSTSPFLCWIFFEIRSWRTVCPGWLLNPSPPDLCFLSI